jgi:hypothetical protein
MHYTNEKPGVSRVIWCSIVDAFQTAAIDAQEDYKLKYLVEQFQLADNLI